MGLCMDTHLRLLIVEDSEDDAQLLLRELRKGGIEAFWKRIDTANAMESALVSGAWDCITSDYVMPAFSGLEALRIARESGLDIPFIIVSGKIGEETAVEAMKAGANDYIVKGNLARLVPAIKREMQEAETRKSQKFAEYALLRARDDWERTFNAVPDMISIIDKDFCVRRFNSAMAARLDSGSREQEQFKCYEIFHKSDAPHPKCPHLLLLHDGKEHCVELELPNFGGWFEMRVSPLRDAEGVLAGSVHVSRDVTERKCLEQQLIQSQKMESIGLLAGGVAHDFNNLLTAITGYGEVIRDNVPEDDELMLESVGQLLEAAQRAAELTRSLLTFGRKQVLSTRFVFVDDIVTNSGKLIKRIIGEDIEFTMSFSSVKLPIMADAGQIEQVLMNLATNARDAMPRGGSLAITVGQVTIQEGSEALFDLSSPGWYARISVTDTGVGIEKELIGRLFEPFFTTKEVGRGTGLGLSIVYGIIKQHDGSILVRSQIGTGTTFTIYLPLVEDNPAMKEQKTPLSIAGGNETLLVVDDEEIVRSYLKRTLEKAGYRVIAAGDGEEAVEMFLQNAEISLVLTDMMMPGKNGKEIIKEIRGMNPEIKAVFISGYTADTIETRGMVEEGVELVTKPFSKDELLRKIRGVLDVPI
jgi:two-component system, cell cycle sensor histidine kinase and response regulator CckA